MQVTCTNCRARYAVDPLAIGPSGRIVQCARCGDRWFQTVKLEPPPPRNFESSAAKPDTGTQSTAATAAASGPSSSAAADKGQSPADKGPVQPIEPSFGSIHRPISPFSQEGMADNFPRFAGPRPPPAPTGSEDRSFIDTMPIPDVVIRPSVRGAGLPALIEPRANRRMSIVLAVALLLVVAAGAAVFVFRADIIALLPAEWRTMLRLT